METSANWQCDLGATRKKISKPNYTKLEILSDDSELINHISTVKQKNISELKVKEPSSKIISSTKQIFLPIKYITHKL